jgi:hypothetical protein
VLFGLGDNDTIDLIEITWPGGVVQRVTGAAPGGTITITERAAGGY